MEGICAVGCHSCSKKTDHKHTQSLLREQWLSDEGLPHINAVGFKFPVNISFFFALRNKNN
jgi:hypothetical protein